MEFIVLTRLLHRVNNILRTFVSLNILCLSATDILLCGAFVKMLKFLFLN